MLWAGASLGRRRPLLHSLQYTRSVTGVVWRTRVGQQRPRPCACIRAPRVPVYADVVSPSAPRGTTSPRCPFGPAPKVYASRCSLPNRLARVRRGLTQAGPSSLLNLPDSSRFTPSFCPHRAHRRRPARVVRHGSGSRRPGRYVQLWKERYRSSRSEGP